ncbi:prefoldin subunit 4-like [Dysidea avara]|uniref:prefoldin subunit 4-like n=1 Tax=Dysidea avara TaxID=196820 RepID=UPI00331EC44D
MDAAKASASDAIEVAKEDQLKINLFAQKNQQMVELKDRVSELEKEAENLKDAEGSVEESSLLDDDSLFPYQIGEMLVHLNAEDTQKFLQKQREQVTEELKELNGQIESIQRVMSDLKVQLYAKFGDNINLEAD